jgi:protein-S-isoprenylcysteine O-methyltransferase Ste14
MEAWKHVRAVVLLPGLVLGVIPATIIHLNGTDTFGLWQSSPAIRVVLALVGLGFVVGGLVLMVSTIRLFATVGQGTLAPWNPPQRLVVRGIYRHVRNPMMLGVCSMLFGEALLTASLPSLCWFAFFVIVVMIAIAVDRAHYGHDFELTVRRTAAADSRPKRFCIRRTNG